ncbi:MAG TPA: rRNA maturation RNase YbeY [Rhizomicrobium sp.]|jgi:probable rRNA maturation factor|nr:rRNA maturation RNase YbeY [Rhizomicrobium sp.]
MSITLMIEKKNWRTRPGLGARIRRAAALTLAAVGRKGLPLTILLADDGKLRALNAAFRGMDKPTNVLSFPAGGGPYLGDVAIAYETTAREALEQRKTFDDHAVHLAVHGVLHLLGYDHETAADARIMEPLEIEILRDLDIRDPYASKAA